MKVKSWEEFNAYIKSIIDQRMKDNIEAMVAAGMSQAEIDECLPCLETMCECAQQEAIEKVQEIFDDRTVN
jgi:predicted dinucleotide-utilizing enzyme